MNTVRFGVIGVGNIGTAHAACLAAGKIEGATLAAVCDIDPSRRAFAEKTWGVPAFADCAALLASGTVDAVEIAVPHPMHADIAMAALASGVHVLVEKPVDITVSKAAALNDTAAQSGLTFGIMFNQRTNPLFAKAREIVKGGALGTFKRTVWIITNWYRTQHYYDSGSWRATWSGEGGGVLLNQAPHNLDLWQWICGMPQEVTAFCDVAKYHRIEVEDDVTIFTRYAGGAVGTFITSTGEYPGTNRLEITGDRGKLVLENGVLKWWRLAAAERDFCFAATENTPDTAVTYEEIRPDRPEAAHAGILQNFTDAVLHGTPLLAPGTDGIFELTLSNAAYLSQWTGNRPVSLPLDTALFDRLLLERISRSTADKTAQTTEKSDKYADRWQVRW